MHILCADDAKPSDSLLIAVRQSDEIYFEIDISDFEGMMKSLQYLRMNNGKKLADLLSPGDYNKVKAYFEKNGSILPFGMLERFKPILISSIIEENGLGCKQTNGMELVIMKESKSQGKHIHGLETAVFQAGLFDSIPYELQAKDLVNYIDSAEQYKKTSLELVEVYKNQDLQKIDELTKTGDITISKYLDLLLYGRNRKWADSLDRILQKKSILVAVGAAHLPGNQGLIQLLRVRGYTVTAVMNSEISPVSAYRSDAISKKQTIKTAPAR